MPMKKRAKRTTSSYRLTADAKRLLGQLAGELGISQTAQLELLIRDEAATRKAASARRGE